jgi:putative phosphoribosyl transferase
MMHMFHDRTDAGIRLSEVLKRYEGTNALVLGIPRGGVEVAYQVAKAPGLHFSIIVARKLPFPDSPESGFGAIAEDGSLYIISNARWMLSQSQVDHIVEQQKEEVTRRIRILRNGRPLPDLKGRHIILIDDGIAMGSTTRAAVMCGRNLGASRVTVAAPAASRDARAALAGLADEVVVLESPAGFREVADFYRNWYDVSDQEVVDIMALAEKSGLLTPPKPNTGDSA